MKTITINGIEYPTYATVEEAEQYFNAKFGSTWSEIEQLDKEKLLVTATREIEKVKFQGYKLDIAQDLAFPRVICSCSINPINPEDILIACCSEIANAIYNLPVTENVITAGADKIKSMSVGDTSITFQDGVTIETDNYSAVATSIIKKYLGRFLKGNIRVIL